MKFGIVKRFALVLTVATSNLVLLIPSSISKTVDSVKEKSNMGFEAYQSIEKVIQSDANMNLLSVGDASLSREPEEDSSLFIHDLDIAFNIEDGEVKLKTSNESDLPKNAVIDQNGNLTHYTIGPDSNESKVEVEYENANTIESLELTRPDGGQKIVYQREKADQSDPDSPYVYSETRNGIRGDMTFSSLNVDKDGRINVYFDFNQKQKALTFNPQSGKEEYP